MKKVTITQKAVRWMLKKYNGQPLPKWQTKLLIEAYKAGHKEAARERE